MLAETAEKENTSSFAKTYEKKTLSQTCIDQIENFIFSSVTNAKGKLITVIALDLQGCQMSLMKILHIDTQKEQRSYKNCVVFNKR